MAVVLDVWSDIACPWCFIGKRRLGAVLQATGAEVDVTWHAFELQPDLPAEGVPAAPFYGKKFGGAERMEQLFARMTELGAQDRIPFAFDRMQRAPNTRLAHRAIRIARELGGTTAQDAVVEACFRAHFCDGVDVADLDALLGALTGTGVDLDTLRTRLGGTDGLAEVVSDEQLAARIGISGVPFFIAQGQLAMSGAQPASVFEGFLAKARELPLAG